MRELSSQEVFEVSGGINFNTPITPTLVNSVSNAMVVGRMLSAAFGVGYMIGTYLNNQYDLSTKIVDRLQ